MNVFPQVPNNPRRKTHWLQYVIYFWCLRLTFAVLGYAIPLIVGLWRAFSPIARELVSTVETVPWSSSLFNVSSAQLLIRRGQPCHFMGLPVNSMQLAISVATAAVDSQATYIKLSDKRIFDYYTSNAASTLCISVYNLSRNHAAVNYSIGIPKSCKWSHSICRTRWSF